MAPFNSELVKKNREIIYKEGREAAFSLTKFFLSDINSSFQEMYKRGFSSREEFLKFMDDPIPLNYYDAKTPWRDGIKKENTIYGIQEFYKIIKEDGDFKIKQLVSFHASKLWEYFSFSELQEVESLRRTGGEEAAEEVPIERVFEILDEEKPNLVGYDCAGSHPPKFYTLLEADLPRINGGFVEYFDVMEEKNESSEDTQYH